MNGFYIAPAFMDKLVVHITKNYMTLPNIKVRSLKFLFWEKNVYKFGRLVWTKWLK